MRGLVRDFRLCPALLLTVGSLLALAGTPRAAEPERLAQKSFDVRVEAGPPPVVEVTFALALSEVSDYPVRITAVSGTVEEQLYFGTLKEGVYRLRAPLTKISSGPLKVVLRTKVTNRFAPVRRKDQPAGEDETTEIIRSTQAAETYIRYLTWEGSIPR
jgi:hypothetical protein